MKNVEILNEVIIKGKEYDLSEFLNSIEEYEKEIIVEVLENSNYDDKSKKFNFDEDFFEDEYTILDMITGGLECLEEDVRNGYREEYDEDDIHTLFIKYQLMY